MRLSGISMLLLRVACGGMACPLLFGEGFKTGGDAGGSNKMRFGDEF
jgi:hypothetical protein